MCLNYLRWCLMISSSRVAVFPICLLLYHIWSTRVMLDSSLLVSESFEMCAWVCLAISVVCCYLFGGDVPASVSDIALMLGWA